MRTSPQLMPPVKKSLARLVHPNNVCAGGDFDISDAGGIRMLVLLGD
jgi:hypothetical protein